MAGLDSLHIVIAEPNATAREFLQKTLQSAGIGSVRIVADVRESWDSIRQKPPHAAVIDWSIASAADFIILRKMYSAGVRTPVVIMVRDQTPQDLTRAARAGAAGFINKPFGPRDLIQEIAKAIKRKKPVPSAAPKAPQKAQTTPTPPPDSTTAEAKAKRLFASAWEDLRLRKYDKAQKKLAAALEQMPDFPEAHKGLAEVAKGKGQIDSAMHHLLRASEIYAYTGKAQQAEALFAEVRKAAPDAKNPFKTAGDRLRQKGETNHAVAAYEHAHAISPKDPDIAVNLSEAYMETGQNERAEETLRAVLESVGEIPAAKDLFLKLTGEEWYYGQTSETEGHEVQILDEAVAEKDGAEMRTHKRLAFADRAIKLPGVQDNLPVIDISLGGLGFKPMSSSFTAGQELRFDLVVMGTVNIKKITAIVRRVSPKIIGCQFKNLSKRNAKLIKQMLGEDD